MKKHDIFGITIVTEQNNAGVTSKREGLCDQMLSKSWHQLDPPIWAHWWIWRQKARTLTYFEGTKSFLEICT